MSWFSISFDGEGLAYARLTRHDRGGTVHLLVGPPTKRPEGTVYPTCARLEGFRRVPYEEIVEVLIKQYGNASVAGAGDGALILVDMPAKRLWADALTNLRAFEDLFGPPHIRIIDGYVTMFVQAIVDLPEAAIRGRLQGAATRADVYAEKDFDTSPWAGLEPRLLEAAP